MRDGVPVLLKTCVFQTVPMSGLGPVPTYVTLAGRDDIDGADGRACQGKRSPESVRLLVVESLARLAPAAVNEGAPVSVAVTLLGSFSVLVIVTGMAGVDRAPAGRHVGRADRHRRAESGQAGSLGKGAEVELAGLNVPPFTSAVVMVLPLLLAVPPATVRLDMVLVLPKFTVAAPATAAEPTVAGAATVVTPPLALRVVTLPELTLTTVLPVMLALVIRRAADCDRSAVGVQRADDSAAKAQRRRSPSMVPTPPPVWFNSLVASIVAEPTLPPPRLSVPPLLIVAVPTLLEALPKLTLPPLIASVGVISARTGAAVVSSARRPPARSRSSWP